MHCEIAINLALKVIVRKFLCARRNNIFWSYKSKTIEMNSSRSDALVFILQLFPISLPIRTMYVPLILLSPLCHIPLVWCLAHFDVWCAAFAYCVGSINFRIEFVPSVFQQPVCNVCKIDDGKYANKMCPIFAIVLCAASRKRMHKIPVPHRQQTTTHQSAIYQAVIENEKNRIETLWGMGNNKKPKYIEIEWLKSSRTMWKKCRIESEQGQRATRGTETGYMDVSECAKTEMKMHFSTLARRKTCFRRQKINKNYLLFLRYGKWYRVRSSKYLHTPKNILTFYSQKLLHYVQ